MKANRIRKELERYEEYLRSEEKSPATVQKYMQSARGFLNYSRGEISQDKAVAYKNKVKEEGKAATTINAELSGIRCYLKSIGREDIKIRNLRVQKRVYAKEDRILTKGEYKKLLEACSGEKSKRAKLIMETICATGIRVSELRYFTKESVKSGEIRIRMKGKERTILMPNKLRKRLLAYAKEEGIKSGAIFIDSKGKALHRSYVWQMMKKIAKKARVMSEKVFPHNLRRLFARCFYELRKDISRLADVLGHSSIDTTRIYIATTAREHMRMIEGLHLVM